MIVDCAYYRDGKRQQEASMTPEEAADLCRSEPGFVWLGMFEPSPEELGRIVGIDLADPGFWDAGLDLVERQLTDAEEAAQASGRV